MFKNFKNISNDDKKKRFKMLRKFIKKKLKKFGRKYGLDTILLLFYLIVIDNFLSNF